MPFQIASASIQRERHRGQAWLSRELVVSRHFPNCSVMSEYACYMYVAVGGGGNTSSGRVSIFYVLRYYLLSSQLTSFNLMSVKL